VNIAIALAQFVILALGVMASRILVNSGAITATSFADQMAVHAANQGVWLLAIPALWLIFAEGCAKFRPGFASAAQSIGVGLAVALLAGIVLILAF
jgi:hypothetical protein